MQIARVGAGFGEHGLVGAGSGRRKIRAGVGNGLARQRPERNAAFQRVVVAFDKREHTTTGQALARAHVAAVIRVRSRIAHEDLRHALGVGDALGIAHGARGFIEVHDFLGGHHAARTVLHHLVDIAGVIVVVGEGDGALEVLDRLDVGKVVIAAKRRVLVRLYHLEEQLFLHLARMQHVGLKLLLKRLSRRVLAFVHHGAQGRHIGHLRGRARRCGRLVMHVVAGRFRDLFVMRHSSPPTVRRSGFP